MTASNLRHHRARHHTLSDNPCLRLIRPTASALRTAQNFNPARSLHRRTVVNHVHNISSCQQDDKLASADIHKRRAPCHRLRRSVRTSGPIRRRSTSQTFAPGSHAPPAACTSGARSDGHRTVTIRPSVPNSTGPMRSGMLWLTARSAARPASPGSRPAPAAAACRRPVENAFQHE